MNEWRIADETIRTVEKLESPQSLYLYVLALDGRFYPIHPVPLTPADPEPEARPWSFQIRTLLHDTLRRVNQVRPVKMSDPDLRAQASLSLVETIASLLSRVPGRKDLIWITHGFPEISYWADYTSAIAGLGAKLNAAEIALYAVQQSVEARISIDSGATLELLSQLTGGRFYGSDQVENAIAQSRTDARAAYEIEYKAPVSRPYQYHKIRVTCNRPGTRILSQQGYYTLPS
jgi:VWFA-related protein